MFLWIKHNRQMLKKLLFILCALLCAAATCTAQTPNNAPTQKAETMKISITVSGRTLTASLYDNSSARALAELLRKGPLTLKMNDYGGFEKVGELPVSLPRNDAHINTDAGDLILYQGKSFVIYYDKNSWSFTPLGKIEGISKSGLKALLGAGSVTVQLSIGGA